MYINANILQLQDRRAILFQLLSVNTLFLFHLIWKNLIVPVLHCTLQGVVHGMAGAV